MTTYNFSGLSNTTTWSDPNFSQDTVNYTQGQVVSETANSSLHCVVASLGGTGIMRAKVIGKTWGSTISAIVTINGVRGFAVTDDSVHVYIVTETGANSWKGYTWVINNGIQHLGILNSTSDYDISDSPNSGLGSAVGDTIAEGDTFELVLNTSTGLLQGMHNGTVTSSVTDLTYSTGLTAGFLVISANHGGTGISQFQTLGDTTGGIVAAPPVGSITQVGTSPIMTSANNTIIRPSVAERKIFLPEFKKAA